MKLHLARTVVGCGSSSFWNCSSNWKITNCSLEYTERWYPRRLWAGVEFVELFCGISTFALQLTSTRFDLLKFIACYTNCRGFFVELRTRQKRHKSRNIIKLNSHLVFNNFCDSTITIALQTSEVSFKRVDIKMQNFAVCFTKPLHYLLQLWHSFTILLYVAYYVTRLLL